MYKNLSLGIAVFSLCLLYGHTARAQVLVTAPDVVGALGTVDGSIGTAAASVDAAVNAGSDTISQDIGATNLLLQHIQADEDEDTLMENTPPTSLNPAISTINSKAAASTVAANSVNTMLVSGIDVPISPTSTALISLNTLDAATAAALPQAVQDQKKLAETSNLLAAVIDNLKEGGAEEAAIAASMETADETAATTKNQLANIAFQTGAGAIATAEATKSQDLETAAMLQERLDNLKDKQTLRYSFMTTALAITTTAGLGAAVAALGLTEENQVPAPGG